MYVEQYIAKGPVGWSFGGIVSLELAAELAYSEIEIAGIIMIDTVYPKLFDDKDLEGFASIPTSVDNVRSEMRYMVARCRAQTGELLRTWTVPKFAPRSATEPNGEVAANLHRDLRTSSSVRASRRRDIRGVPSNTGDIMGELNVPKHSRAGISQASSNLDPINQSRLPRAPPVVLLRCKDYVYVQQSQDSSRICEIDAMRRYRRLGWENHDHGLVSQTRNIPGHHFNIFTFQHVSCQAILHGQSTLLIQSADT